LTEYQSYSNNKPASFSVDDSAEGIPSDEKLTEMGYPYGNCLGSRR